MCIRDRFLDFLIFCLNHFRFISPDLFIYFESSFKICFGSVSYTHLSIVRGTTSKKIVDMLRLAGAREVHMLISSPPVAFPCFFGIDTPSHDQLVGSKNTVEEIRKIIGADTLHYLSREDLLKTVEGAVSVFSTYQMSL